MLDYAGDIHAPVDLRHARWVGIARYAGYASGFDNQRQVCPTAGVASGSVALVGRSEYNSLMRGVLVLVCAGRALVEIPGRTAV